MLQQTQVATVIPYWHRWMDRFPDVEALAASDEQDALSLWQGLGYYRRCKMLLAGAKWVVEHGSPESADGWLRVPGVGRYTAGAISSIAFGEATPVVDGNVERVFARLTACEEVGGRLNRAAWAWASESLDEERPGEWNQALMELGATVCRPLAPICTECPFASNCTARLKGLQEELPRNAPRRAIVEMRQHVLVPISDRGRFGVRQIPEGEWWAGMWEFPRATDLADLPWTGDVVGSIRHQVTHHRIELRVYRVREIDESPRFTWVSGRDLEKLPMPSPQRKALKLATQPTLL